MTYVTGLGHVLRLYPLLVHIHKAFYYTYITPSVDKYLKYTGTKILNYGAIITFYAKLLNFNATLNTSRVNLLPTHLYALFLMGKMNLHSYFWFGRTFISNHYLPLLIYTKVILVCITLLLQ